MLHGFFDGSLNIMMECHYCGEAFEKIQSSSLARCCIKRCSKYYCIECIKHFNPEFDMQMYRKDTWICFSCQEICLCDKCKRIENDKKNKKKMNNSKNGKPQGEESIEQSASNVTPKGEICPQDQPQQSLQQEMQEQGEEAGIEESEFKCYSQEQMTQFPPFYRKIAQRRNQYYNFVIEESRKRRKESRG